MNNNLVEYLLILKESYPAIFKDKKIGIVLKITNREDLILTAARLYAKKEYQFENILKAIQVIQGDFDQAVLIKNGKINTAHKLCLN